MSSAGLAESAYTRGDGGEGWEAGTLETLGRELELTGFDYRLVDGDDKLLDTPFGPGGASPVASTEVHDPDGNVVATLELYALDTPRSAADDALRGELDQAHLLGVAIAALVAVIAGLFMAGRLSSPLRRLAQAARGISAGGGVPEPLPRGTREVRDLEEALVGLAVDLERQQRARRQLAQDLSHEAAHAAHAAAGPHRGHAGRRGPVRRRRPGRAAHRDAAPQPPDRADRAPRRGGGERRRAEDGGRRPGRAGARGPRCPGGRLRDARARARVGRAAHAGEGRPRRGAPDRPQPPQQRAQVRAPGRAGEALHGAGVGRGRAQGARRGAAWAAASAAGCSSASTAGAKRRTGAAAPASASRSPASWPRPRAARSRSSRPPPPRASCSGSRPRRPPTPPTVRPNA